MMDEWYADHQHTNPQVLVGAYLISFGSALEYDSVLPMGCADDCECLPNDTFEVYPATIIF